MKYRTIDDAMRNIIAEMYGCLLYTSDAADDV